MSCPGESYPTACRPRYGGQKRQYFGKRHLAAEASAHEGTHT